MAPRRCAVIICYNRLRLCSEANELVAVAERTIVQNAFTRSCCRRRRRRRTSGSFLNFCKGPASIPRPQHPASPELSGRLSRSWYLLSEAATIRHHHPHHHRRRRRRRRRLLKAYFQYLARPRSGDRRRAQGERGGVTIQRQVGTKWCSSCCQVKDASLPL